LLPETKSLLLELVDSAEFIEKYVLAGGTALSLYLGHRKSEDLDFFTYDDSFDKKEIFEYVKRFQIKEILNQTDEQIDLLVNGVKITFFNSAWSFLKPEKIEKFNLAKIESIAAMKVHTLFLRAKYRDYYDLYFLAKKYMSLTEIFESSKNILEGINFKLFAIAIVYIDDIEDDNIDHLEPIAKISKTEIRSFFEKRLAEI
jgi:predicted nucleotidyltransferase component of viral defense system